MSRGYGGHHRETRAPGELRELDLQLLRGSGHEWRRCPESAGCAEDLERGVRGNVPELRGGELPVKDETSAPRMQQQRVLQFSSRQSFSSQAAAPACGRPPKACRGAEVGSEMESRLALAARRHTVRMAFFLRFQCRERGVELSLEILNPRRLVSQPTLARLSTWHIDPPSLLRQEVSELDPAGETVFLGRWSQRHRGQQQGPPGCSG